MRKLLVLLAALVVVFAFVGCKQKEEPITKPGQPGGEAASPHGVMPPVQTQIVVPESVAGKWKAVTLVIENKTTKKSDEVTIPLEGEYAIPGSNLKIEVGQFLPDFKMSGSTITSASNELNNPAVHVDVFEGDKQIFTGWLYSKFPAIHPFEHDTYALTLKEGIKATS
ncbi:MAG: DUF2155 domain-containing protein [Nitrospirota bacterium]|jgi:hypothetical protein